MLHPDGPTRGEVRGPGGRAPGAVLLATTAAEEDGPLAVEEILKLAARLRAKLPAARIAIAGGLDRSPGAARRAAGLAADGVELLAGAIDRRRARGLRRRRSGAALGWRRADAAPLVVIHAPARARRRAPRPREAAASRPGRARVRGGARGRARSSRPRRASPGSTWPVQRPARVRSARRSATGPRRPGSCSPRSPGRSARARAARGGDRPRPLRRLRGVHHGLPFGAMRARRCGPGGGRRRSTAAAVARASPPARRARRPRATSPVRRSQAEIAALLRHRRGGQRIARWPTSPASSPSSAAGAPTPPRTAPGRRGSSTRRACSRSASCAQGASSRPSCSRRSARARTACWSRAATLATATTSTGTSAPPRATRCSSARSSRPASSPRASGSPGRARTEGERFAATVRDMTEALRALGPLDYPARALDAGPCTPSPPRPPSATRRGAPGKPRVAFYWNASCGGCEEAVMDLGEGLAALARAASRWCSGRSRSSHKRADVEALPDGGIDVAFVNGAVRLTEQDEWARLLRRKARRRRLRSALARTWAGWSGSGTCRRRREILDAACRKPASGLEPGRAAPRRPHLVCRPRALAARAALARAAARRRRSGGLHRPRLPALASDRRGGARRAARRRPAAGQARCSRRTRRSATPARARARARSGSR